jgi:hypothetical protein
VGLWAFLSTLMTTAQLEDYTCFIHALPAALYDYLSDPRNYKGLQPFVIDVRDVVYDTDAQGKTFSRSVTVERFHFLRFIRYDNPIRVRLTMTEPNEVLESHVDSPGWTQVHFRATFRPEAGGTRISESVTIQMPRLLQGYVVKQARFAQRLRFTNLKALFEGASPPAARHIPHRT